MTSTSTVALVDAVLCTFDLSQSTERVRLSRGPSGGAGLGEGGEGGGGGGDGGGGGGGDGGAGAGPFFRTSDVNG